MRKNMSYEEWPIPEDLLKSPAVTNRNLFAQKYSTIDTEKILKKYVYSNSNQLKTFFNIVFDAIKPTEFAGTGLELGAGVCVFSALICQEFKKVNNVYSIELVKDVVKLLQPKTISKLYDNSNSKINSVHGSFDNLQLDDNSVDFAFEWASFHHSDNIDITLSEVTRVLKSGGPLLILDRAQYDYMTDEQKKFMLDLEYSDEFKRGCGFDSKPLTRSQNGEHEIRLKEWLESFSKAGLSLEKRLELRIVSAKILLYGMVLFLPFKLRKVLKLWPSRVRWCSDEWLWMLATLLGLGQSNLYIKAPRNFTLFLLKKS